MQNTYQLRKFTGPALPHAFIHRKILVARLQEAIARELRDDGTQVSYKLVLLCAPAGYGKTTLLADFAHSTSIACCWYFLDSTDVYFTVFLHNLLASVRHVFPSFGSSLDGLFTNLFTKGTSSNKYIYQSAMDALCSAFSTEINEHFALCLCNYEEINESETLNQLFTYLLKVLPPHVTLVIESRVMPDISFVPLFVREEMYGFDRNSLRFSAQDISDLARLHGLTTFTEAQAEQLATTFDGWITGILLGTRLGDLHFYSPNQDMHFGDLDIASSHKRPVSTQKRKNLFTYIVSEVFQSDMDAYTFLQAASLLQEMEPAMCNALLGITDAAEYLDRLEHNGLFITSYGHDTELIYCCHPVIRDILYEELRQQDPERFAALHHKAAELWYACGNYDQAMQHAIEAGADDLAVQVIFDAYKQLLQQGHLDTLTDWLERLPAVIRENNLRLLMIQATLFLSRGLHTTALPLLDKASVLANAEANDDSQEKIQIIQVEIDILRSKVLFQAGDYSGAQKLCQQALLQLPNDEIELRAAAEMRLGICANMQGDFLSGLTYLQQALHIWNAQLPMNQAADIHGALANTYDLIGNFDLAEYHLTRALDYCDQSHDEQSKVDNLIRKGLLHLHRGTYAEAETTLLQALTLARTSLHDQRGEAYALANLGSLYMEQAMYPQALAFCEDGLTLAYNCGNRSLINITLSNIATTLLLMGDTTGALLFAEKIDVHTTDEKVFSYEQVWRELTYGMIFLYQGRYEEAYMCLSSIEEEPTINSLKRVQLQARLRLAACQLARNRQTEAIQLLAGSIGLFASNDSYKQLAHVELKWQPALLLAVKSLPQLSRLREVIGLVTDTQQETKQLQTTSSLSTEPTLLPKLTIQAFGEPVVLIDHQPIKHWRMARAMELFFFLLNANNPLGKEHILTELWPEFDDQINQTFHSTLHHLRKLLGESSIVFQAGSYSLNLATCYGENIWYDVKEFQMRQVEAKRALAHGDDLAAKKALLRMVELYQGDYGRPFYSDWCTARRDELRTAYLEAQGQLAQIAWQNKAYNECIHYSRQLLNVDNCQEEAHYNIMLCYVHQSRRSDALRQYQFCKETLQQELGLQPGSAIEELYQSLT